MLCILLQPIHFSVHYLGAFVMFAEDNPCVYVCIKQPKYPSTGKYEPQTNALAPAPH